MSGRFLRASILFAIYLTVALGVVVEWTNATISEGSAITVNSLGDQPDTNTADATCLTVNGDCTLRAAIQQAGGNPGQDTIGFDLAGAPPYVIQPNSPLPAIPANTTIDATTEPDFAGTPVVVVNGDFAGVSNGLELYDGGSVVRGLVINRFVGNGILTQGQGNLIVGNYIGTDVSGTIDQGNSENGVSVQGASPGQVVGGLSPEDRNVISGNNHAGIRLASVGTVVRGNLVGTNASGTVAVGNSVGIVLDGARDAMIGGPSASSRNVISGNVNTGIELSGAGPRSNSIQGNYIGTGSDGLTALPNGKGITITINGGNDNWVGGTEPGQGNIIAFSTGGPGIQVQGLRNSIRGNSIHSNSGLGIDNLTGGNGELSPPVVSNVNPVSGSACAGCTVDVFSDSADEGRTYHGSTSADSNGDWTFTGPVDGPNVTATATDIDGNTSEFSAPFPCDGACESAVGGIAELPDVDSAALETSSSGYAVNPWLFLIAMLAGAAVLGGVAFYWRRHTAS